MAWKLEPDLAISARTNRNYRDDGSFWPPLRQAFRFELPTEVLRLIHKHYVVAEFEFASTAVSRRSDQQLLLDLQRYKNAYEESGHCMCLCGKVGGCCYDIRGPDEEDEGYGMHCSAGEVWLKQVYLMEDVWAIEAECKERGLAVSA